MAIVAPELIMMGNAAPSVRCRAHPSGDENDAQGNENDEQSGSDGHREWTKLAPCAR
jgi:hypothetical protein